MTPHELLCWPEDCGWRGRWWWGGWVRVWKEDDDVVMNIDDEHWSMLIIEQSELEKLSCPEFDYSCNCFLTGFVADWILLLTLYSWLFSFLDQIYQVSSFFWRHPCQFAWFACSFHVWQHWFCTGSAYFLPVPFWAASASAGVFRRRDSSLWRWQQWIWRKWSTGVGMIEQQVYRCVCVFKGELKCCQMLMWSTRRWRNSHSILTAQHDNNNNISATVLSLGKSVERKRKKEKQKL